MKLYIAKALMVITLCACESYGIQDDRRCEETRDYLLRLDSFRSYIAPFDSAADERRRLCLIEIVPALGSVDATVLCSNLWPGAMSRPELYGAKAFVKLHPCIRGY